MNMGCLRLYKQTKHKLLSKPHITSSNNQTGLEEYVAETAIRQHKSNIIF